jgi:hypothetical protein
MQRDGCLPARPGLGIKAWEPSSRHSSFDVRSGSNRVGLPLYSALRQRIVATVGTIESRPPPPTVTIFAQKNTLTS